MRKVRTRLRISFIVLMLLVGQPQFAGWLIGWPLILLGIALHLWASGTLTKNMSLTTSGPYRFVRNPFYVADFIRDVGVLLCCNFGLEMRSIPGWTVAAVYFAVRYGIVIRRRVLYKEEPNLLNLFGDEYEAFRRSVPRFVPRLWPVKSNCGSSTGILEGFNWRNLSRHHEIPRTVSDLVLIGALYFRWEVIHHSLQWSHVLDNMWDMLLLAAVVCVFIGNVLPVERWISRTNMGWLSFIRRAPAIVLIIFVIALSLITSHEYENNVVTWTVGLTLCLPAFVLRIAWKGGKWQPNLLGWMFTDALSFVGLAMLAELVWMIPIALLISYLHYKVHSACTQLDASDLHADVPMRQCAQLPFAEPLLSARFLTVTFMVVAVTEAFADWF